MLITPLSFNNLTKLKTSQFNEFLRQNQIMESGEINNFKINLENYNGPLDVLLDLAKSQKVNLADTFRVKG